MGVHFLAEYRLPGTLTSTEHAQKENHFQRNLILLQKTMNSTLFKMMMQQFRRILDSPAFTKYLLVTNVVSGGTIDLVGDVITQKKLEGAETINWRRSGRMMAVAIMLSAPAHFWYLYLERVFPLKTAAHMAKKLTADTVVAGPFLISGFYLG